MTNSCCLNELNVPFIVLMVSLVWQNSVHQGFFQHPVCCSSRVPKQTFRHETTVFSRGLFVHRGMKVKALSLVEYQHGNMVNII